MKPKSYTELAYSQDPYTLECNLEEVTMTTVWKFQFDIKDKTSVKIPCKHKIIKVDTDTNNQPCLWAFVDRESPLVDMNLLIYGTGHDISSSIKDYIGSIKLGWHIWHIFTE